MKYCDSIYQTERRKTRVVMVGQVGVGGQNPIRIQSMTTSNTRDVDATIDQIMRLSDAGCEIARVTVQGKKEAECCEGIKNGLIRRGCSIPLVADIHFYPPAALLVAEFVDKVRINPGNFVDQRAQFKMIEYNDTAYVQGLIRIEEKFSLLVEKCKRLHVAMRIGTNHGSLSDRIMNRYGDSPRGMVESALEFARICRQMDYHDLIFSMKASNPQVMIEAYRLLVSEMIRLGWDYPLHLGVTEAGAGEGGRIKSAMGIGALLMDGLGDTIRVSLTEDPWCEIDPCRRIISFVEEKITGSASLARSPMRRQEKKKDEHGQFFDDNDHFRHKVINPLHPDGAVVVKASIEDLANVPIGDKQPDAIWIDPMPERSQIQRFIDANIRIFDSTSIAVLKGETLPLDGKIPEFILFQPARSPIHETRYLIADLKKRGLNIPVILSLSYDVPWEDLIIRAGIEAGALFCDGLGEGICIDSQAPIQKRLGLSFAILQSARMRITQTEFISCPGCGRTLFALQEVARNIRERTGHLSGVKIAIMGCIVNGPGEMADADFGYVGSKPGRIDLYVGKTCVERDVAIDDATDKLIALIAAHGKWKEP